MVYPRFDPTKLRLRAVTEREHDVSVADLVDLDYTGEFSHPALSIVAERIQRARSQGSAVIAMMGAHVIKTGMSRFVIQLMKEGYLTHIALNGAGAIHDYELALVGATSESVARYIRKGEFGLWQETGGINDIARQAATTDLGFGEALGRAISEGDFPYKDISILAAGYRARVPVTIHVALGQDIIHQHPNCSGAALGEVSYRDFLTYVQSVDNLEGGVLLNIGTAVMGPEVYLKALSMVRNVAEQTGRRVSRFTTAVFDLHPYADEDYHREMSKEDPRYYYRPWKTILVRTVADGGESYYIQGEHRQTLPALYHLLASAAKGTERGG